VGEDELDPFAARWAGEHVWEGDRAYVPLVAIQTRLRVVEETLLVLVAGDRRLTGSTYNTTEALWARKLYMMTHFAYRRLKEARGYPLEYREWPNLGGIPDEDVKASHVKEAGRLTLEALVEDRLTSATVALSMHANFAVGTTDRKRRRTVNRTLAVLVREVEGLTNLRAGVAPWRRIVEAS
jgi:hypothetical protein